MQNCIEVKMLYRYLLNAFTIALLTVNIPQISWATPQNVAACEAETDSFGKLAAQVMLEVSAPPDLRSGGEITLSWTRGVDFPLKKPVYLIVQTAEDVRFSGPMVDVNKTMSDGRGGTWQSTEKEGPGFFALPPASRAPLNIEYGKGRMRVFVPFHAPGTRKASTITIKPYRWGEFPVRWAFVAKTSCGERLLGAEGQQAFDVLPARPEIAVQDAYALEKPVKIIESNSGQYRLHIFDGSYKVLDAKNGALVIERDGTEPAFSPTSRFLTARKDGGTDLIDLTAGIVARQIHAGALAWAFADTFAIHDGGGLGAIDVIPTLSDAGRANTETGCRLCRGWESGQVSIDLDNGLALFDQGASLAELASGRNFSCPINADIAACASKHIGDYYSVAPFKLPQRWEIEGGLKLTQTDAFDKTQGRFVVSHREIGTSETLLANAAGQTEAKGGGDWRGRITQKSASIRDVSIGDVLSTAFDLAPNDRHETYDDPTPWNAGVADESPKALENLEKLRSAMVQSVPYADRVLSKTRCDYTGDCTEAGIHFEEFKPGIANIYLGKFTKGLWAFNYKGKKIWLHHLEAAEGASGSVINARLLMFRGDKQDQQSLVDLTTLFGDSLQDQWPPTILKPYLSNGRYLIVPDLQRRQIAVYDLEQEARTALVDNITSIEIVEAVQLTSDHRFIVQFNKDKQFYFYNIKTDEQVLSGRMEDQEAIIYDKRGYYAATYEGAYFVNLRFPGIQGLHSFQQFQATLNRPDIIDAILKGTPSAAADPLLLPPPEIEIVLATITDAGYALEVKARGQKDLVALRIYQDGKLVDEAPVLGKALTTTLRGARYPHARWLTVQAVDVGGTVSRPEVRPMASGSAPTAKLHAVTVGVNLYADKAIRQLDFAKADAENLTRALTTNAGRYYGSVSVQSRVDKEASKFEVLAALDEAVDAAGPDDTVLFSFSGHGVKSGDGRFYLATTDAQAARLEETALGWADVAIALKKSKSRVIVFLDACHSGAAGADAFAANDDAVKALVTDAKIPMVVFAASKGRQFSLEAREIKGGFFTNALTQVLGVERAKYDRNGNGAIEISELYLAAKAKVVEQTRGQQTPWLARFDLIGDFAVF